MNVNAKQAAQALIGADNILIIIHAKPDGDAVGSGFGLLSALRGIGKTAYLNCSDRLAERYDFIVKQCFPEFAFFGTDIPSECAFSPKFTVTADIAADSLMGSITGKYKSNIDLCIDHHDINTLEAKNSLVVPSASAAGEVLCDVIDEMSGILGKSICTPQVANALFCAVASDSGSFRYGNTTAKTFLCASRLKELGADTEKISRYLFESRSVAGYRLYGKVVENTHLYHNGKLSISHITLSELSAIGADERDVEGASGLVREIAGVEVGIFLREKADGTCKVSFRSNGNTNVAEICRSFGGGGHIKAAGCTISGSCDDVEAQLAELPDLQYADLK